MEKKELLQKVAPCSLMCYTCSAYEKGVICESAQTLLKYMEGMDEFYRRHSVEEVHKFERFQDELKRYGQGECSGCRNREHHGCSIKGCFILQCTQEHHADYCGECEEFPCEKVVTLFEKEVYLQWLKGNSEIKQLGIQGYWDKNATRPHYKAYKEEV